MSTKTSTSNPATDQRAAASVDACRFGVPSEDATKHSFGEHDGWACFRSKVTRMVYAAHAESGRFFRSVSEGTARMRGWSLRETIARGHRRRLAEELERGVTELPHAPTRATIRADLEQARARAALVIDGAYWSFTRTARGKPPAVTVPHAYAERNRCDALLRALGRPTLEERLEARARGEDRAESERCAKCGAPPGSCDMPDAASCPRAGERLRAARAAKELEESRNRTTTGGDR